MNSYVWACLECGEHAIGSKAEMSYGILEHICGQNQNQHRTIEDFLDVIRKNLEKMATPPPSMPILNNASITRMNSGGPPIPPPMPDFNNVPAVRLPSAKGLLPAKPSNSPAANARLLSELKAKLKQRKHMDKENVYCPIKKPKNVLKATPSDSSPMPTVNNASIPQVHSSGLPIPPPMPDFNNVPTVRLPSAKGFLPAKSPNLPTANDGFLSELKAKIKQRESRQ